MQKAFQKIFGNNKAQKALERQEKASEALQRQKMDQAFKEYEARNAPSIAMKKAFEECKERNAHHINRMKRAFEERDRRIADKVKKPVGMPEQ